MKNIKEIESLLKKHKLEYIQKYKIKNIGIFGSYSRGEQTNKSDLDILIEFEHPVGFEFVDLADDIESLLKIRVDLVSRGAIKPKMWEFISKDLIYV